MSNQREEEFPTVTLHSVWCIGHRCAISDLIFRTFSKLQLCIITLSISHPHLTPLFLSRKKHTLRGGALCTNLCKSFQSFGQNVLSAVHLHSFLKIKWSHFMNQNHFQGHLVFNVFLLFDICLQLLSHKWKFRIILCLCDPVSVEACVSSSAVARLVHLALLELQPDLAHESCHQPQQPHLVSSSEVENCRSRSSLVAVSVGPRGCNLIQFVFPMLILMWILIWMICY